MIRVPFISCALIITVAACGRPDPVAENASGANPPLAAKNATPDPAGLPPENAATPTNATAPKADAAIPAALHGRWGLTPADCTSTRGDAKGLLAITRGDLHFYESRAVPSGDVQTDANSVAGHFNFTGEGQTWSKYEALKRDGTKLTRTETNPAASYTYAKC
jgi:hypothetical protein